MYSKNIFCFSMYFAVMFHSSCSRTQYLFIFFFRKYPFRLNSLCHFIAHFLHHFHAHFRTAFGIQHHILVSCAILHYIQYRHTRVYMLGALFCPTSFLCVYYLLAALIFFRISVCLCVLARAQRDYLWCWRVGEESARDQFSSDLLSILYMACNNNNNTDNHLTSFRCKLCANCSNSI